MHLLERFPPDSVNLPRIQTNWFSKHILILLSNNDGRGLTAIRCANFTCMHQYVNTAIYQVDIHTHILSIHTTLISSISFYMYIQFLYWFNHVPFNFQYHDCQKYENYHDLRGKELPLNDKVIFWLHKWYQTCIPCLQKPHKLHSFSWSWMMSWLTGRCGQLERQWRNRIISGCLPMEKSGQLNFQSQLIPTSLPVYVLQ